MPTPLINRVAHALLLQTLSKTDLAIMLSIPTIHIAFELLQLAKRGHVAALTWPKENPTYYLTREGREWAQKSLESVS